MDIVCENRHRALDDAKVLWEFMKKVEAIGRGEELEKLMQKMTMPVQKVRDILII